MIEETDDAEVLKRELLELFAHIQKIRKELAALNPKTGGEDHFSGMSDQLDAIVEATEQATNTIMTSVEEIDTLVTSARGEAEADARNAILDGVSERINSVFEACSFQDITGQRINKVVNSLKFVEDRVNRVILMWGAEELHKLVEVIEEERKVAAAQVDPDKALLNGPALPGTGVTQADVDRIISQAEIDKLFG
jgi:chemotaxis protein CheZ